MSADRSVLHMWVVYDHPVDFPDCYVARRQEVNAQGGIVSPEHFTAATLLGVRKRLARMGLYRLNRLAGDDPVIVEIWI